MRKSNFGSLTAALECYFENNLDELPLQVKERLERGFPPGEDSPCNRGPMLLASMWDSFAPDQRREAARQWDCQHDPTNEADSDRMFELMSYQSELESKIKEVKIGPYTDVTSRDRHLEGLKDKLVGAEASILALVKETGVGSGNVADQSDGRAKPVSGVEAKNRESVAPAAKRKSNGLDYRPFDAPLVAEMRELIEAGNAGSPENAARALWERAKGSRANAGASIVKRLALRYREKFPDQPVE